jgi:hypothetical protein
MFSFSFLDCLSSFYDKKNIFVFKLTKKKIYIYIYMKINQYFLLFVVFLLGILFSHIIGGDLIEAKAAQCSKAQKAAEAKAAQCSKAQNAAEAKAAQCSKAQKAAEAKAAQCSKAQQAAAPPSCDGIKGITNIIDGYGAWVSLVNIFDANLASCASGGGDCKSAGVVGPARQEEAKVLWENGTYNSILSWMSDARDLINGIYKGCVVDAIMPLEGTRARLIEEINEINSRFDTLIARLPVSSHFKTGLIDLKKSLNDWETIHGLMV